LTPRQQQQLVWLDTLPPKFDRMKRIVEQLASLQATDHELQALGRMLQELKAQAAQAGLVALADNFGYMGMLLRRGGGHQLKVRGLRELLAGAKTNFEGAYREASTPPAEAEDQPGDVSP
jgi:hypothetical protein